MTRLTNGMVRGFVRTAHELMRVVDCVDERVDRLGVADDEQADRVEPGMAADISKAVDEWAVVQELLPFGYRIDKICVSRKQAEREACASRYLIARPLEWVRSENERLRQPTEFKRSHP